MTYPQSKPTMATANTQPSKIRATWSKGVVSVKLLIQHEMESGQRKDASGKLIPAWFVKTVEVIYQTKNIAIFHFGPAVSKNPFIAFEFSGGKVGDALEVKWQDNQGHIRTDVARIV